MPESCSDLGAEGQVDDLTHYMQATSRLRRRVEELEAGLRALLDWAEKPEGQARLRMTEALDLARALLREGER